jgi:hypothetical protein
MQKGKHGRISDLGRPAPEGRKQFSPALQRWGGRAQRKRVPAGRQKVAATALFPQPSTAINPILVTNNLDREFWKAQAYFMRAGFPHKLDSIIGAQPEAKSLLRSILAVSPCGSRFYADNPRSRSRKLLGINILEKESKKKCDVSPVQPLAKSLFHNILAVSSCGSGFYEDLVLSSVSKFLEINILGNRSKKKRRRPRAIPVHPNSCFAILQYKSIDSANCFFSMYSPSVCAT